MSAPVLDRTREPRRARRARPRLLVIAAVATVGVLSALATMAWKDSRGVSTETGAAHGWAPPTASAPTPEPAPATAGRDPWFRPFSSRSIWNMPIGDAAVYVPAQLRPATQGVGLDQVLLVRTSAADPLRPVLQPAHWTHRCGGTVPTGLSVHVPDGVLVPDARRDANGGWVTPNNVAALLQPDGRTLVNINAVARCDPSGPLFGYATGQPALDVTDLYGDGILGSHGGSRLSGLGGAIRPGELDGTTPLQHALDLVISAEHLHFAGGQGHRWPAQRADGYAAPDTYRGSVPDLRMGSLLAVPPSLTPDDLGLVTPVGRQVFAALQDYGGYVTDDAAWDRHYLSVDAAAIGTFPWGPAEQDEINRLFGVLAVVANNGPDAVGGGGVPRRPLLPELSAP